MAHLPTDDLMRNGSPWLARCFRPELAVLVGIFLLFYFFKLANYSLQIDDEFTGTRTSPEVWLMQGRWGAYLFERWILPDAAIPFLATFLFGLFAAIGYLLLLAAHGVSRPGALHYATFPLFVAFPTWMYLAAFAGNIGAAGLGMMLCCLAAYTYREFTARRHGKAGGTSWFLFAAIVLEVSAATGIYQSYVFAAAVLGLGVLLGESLRKPLPCRRLIMDGVFLLAALVLGILLYKLVNELALKLAGIADDGYVGSIANISLFLDNPGRMLEAVWEGVRRVYSGNKLYYGISAPGFAALIALGALAVVLAPAPLSKPQRVCNVLIVAIILFMPFVMHAFSGGMPLRTLVAVPAVVWLFAVIGLTCGRRWLELMMSVVLVASLFSILNINNGMQAVDSHVRAHDGRLAADMYRRVAEVNPGFDTRKPQVIDIHGAKPFDSMFSRPWSSTWGYSFFEWDGGNMLRMLSYMRLQGYGNLVSASIEQRQANLERFRAMPQWPAADSVRVVDGVTLIKLGDVPGYPFTLQR